MFARCCDGRKRTARMAVLAGYCLRVEQPQPAAARRVSLARRSRKRNRQRNSQPQGPGSRAPVRGLLGLRPEGAFELIDQYLGPKAEIDVLLNRVIVPGARLWPHVNAGITTAWAVAYAYSPAECFLEVEADYVAVKRWLLENALPAGFTLDECRSWLVMLPEHPRLTKKEAIKEFRAAHGSLGDNEFDRAWSEAAHLSWRAPGRPRGK
jgi:hypothetical protein